MGEPAKLRHFGLGEPHPLLKLKPPAPRLKGRCTPQHFRRNVGVRLMPMCNFLNEVCWLSAKYGYCYGYQKTLADQLGCHVNTIARMTKAAEKDGMVTVVHTGRENLIFPNWERLQLLEPEVVDLKHQDGGSHPLGVLKERGPEKPESSSAPDPRTHTCEMQAAAFPVPQDFPRETGLSDAHGCDVYPASPDQPPASSVLLPPRAPAAGSLPAPERPQKPQKHRGESLPDPDLHQRLVALVGGLCAVWAIVRGVPPEDHRLIVQELEHVRPDHAGRYVHSLIRDWTRRRVVALEREQAELRARAAAQKRREAEREAEAEQARASAQAAQERAAGDDPGAEVLRLVREGGLSARGITSRPRAGPS